MNTDAMVAASPPCASDTNVSHDERTSPLSPHHSHVVMRFAHGCVRNACSRSRNRETESGLAHTLAVNTSRAIFCCSLACTSRIQFAAVTAVKMRASHFS